MSETLMAIQVAPVLRFRRGGVARAAVAVLALTAAADWLFYGRDFGISSTVFILFIGLAFFACLPRAVTPGRMIRAALVLAAAALPWFVAAGWNQASLSLAGCAIASATLSVEPGMGVLRAAMWPVLGMGWKIIPDFAREAMLIRAARRGKWSPVDAIIWVFPAGLGVVFILLFAAANPIIGNAVSVLNWGAVCDVIFSARFWFWLTVAALLWPFLAPATLKPAKPRALPMAQPGIGSVLLGRAAVLRSLIVFNLLFAAQTVMDIDYLWLGHALPAGSDYASYAHQGAYPLIVTALLAGAFTIVAARPGSAAVESRWIRWLVLGWILQNLQLVFSSVLRLKIYVDVYQLTELRLAALIWMMLVAVGLVLILARMWMGRSNLWLVRANAVAVLVVLYGCSFVSFADVVAMYDVRHCFEVSGRGQVLDLDYVAGLGVQAIPALDFYQMRTVKIKKGPPFAFLYQGKAGVARVQLVSEFERGDGGWRGWNIWRWHLETYLITHKPDAAD